VTTAPGAPPPPPPPPPPPGAVRVGGDVKEPRKITDVRPIYPAIARAAGLSAVVILETVIDEGGNVTSVRVLRGHPMLDQAAIDAVQQWKYTPTSLNGVPVSLIMTVTVNFQLANSTLVPRMRFANASVRDILRTISELTRTNVTFAADIQSELLQPHTLDVEQMSLEAVLTQLLEPHGLKFVNVGSGTILVQRSPDRPR
jgi:TonB family protein